MTEKALKINDNDFRVWANLGLAYQWLNEKDRAAAAMERELALLEPLSKNQPSDATLQSALAVLYAAQKQKGRALSALQNALALAPADTQILSDAAETYERLGERDKALKYAEMGLSKGYPLNDLKSNPAMQALLADSNFRAPGK
jgi:Flp pilus assembly protein TadD